MHFSYEDRSRVHQYLFISNDRSWIQPYFNRLVNDRLLHLLPAGLSPNLLTFIGHSSAWAAFIMIYLDRFGSCLPLPPTTTFAIAIALMFIYCICDSLDGMYARYWKVETPLGDFYDHWLDCFIGFTIPIGLFLALDAPPHLLGLLTLCYGFGWTANNLERRENRALVLPVFGAMEANFLVIGVFTGVTLVPSLIPSSEFAIYFLIAIGCLGFINAGWSAVAKIRGQKTGLFCAMIGIGPLLTWSLLIAAEGGQQWMYGLLVSAALVLKYNGDILRNILIGTAYKPCDFISIGLSAMLLITHIALRSPAPDYLENILLSILAFWAAGMCAVQLVHTTWFCGRELGIRVFLLNPEQQRAVSGQIRFK
ncbi:MAG: CDP-alcohol phosphatidyltransferase family protein [Methylobacter sp.]